MNEYLLIVLVLEILVFFIICLLFIFRILNFTEKDCLELPALGHPKIKKNRSPELLVPPVDPAVYKNECLELPALGRPFRLGMLYNQHLDKIIPGMSLWDESVLTENVVVQDQWSCHTTIFENDNISSKSSSLEIRGGLKLSLLGDMLKAEGAAKYIYDRKSSTRQARVTVKYSATTHYHQMSMEQICKVAHAADIAKSGATHVVMGVLYGSDAFLLFTQECTHEESIHEIQGKMTSAIKIMEGLSGDLSGNGKTDYIKNNKHLVIQLYGDIPPLDQISITEDKYSVIKNRIMELRQNKNNSVVKTVFLYPLAQLNSLNLRVPKMFHISEDLTLPVEIILEDLQDARIELNDLRRSDSCRLFVSVQQQISACLQIIKQFEVKFKEELSETIYKVRRNGEIQKFKQLIHCVQQSPFNRKCLKKYIENKECELKILMQHRKNMTKFGLLQHKVGAFPCSQSDLSSLVHDVTLKNVFCLVLNVTAMKTPLMEAMATYLEQPLLTVDVVATNAADDYVEPIEIVTCEWFHDRHIKSRLIDLMKKFKDFYMDNKSNEKVIFVVAENDYNCTETGPTILQHRNGRSLNFTPPSRTQTPSADCFYRSISLSLPSRNADGIAPDNWDIRYHHDKNELERKPFELSTPCRSVSLSSLWMNSTYYITAQAHKDDFICPKSETLTATTAPNTNLKGLLI